MDFKQQLHKNNFVITLELTPPKGTNVDKIISEAASLKDKIAAFNLTDNQRAVMRLSSLAFAHRLKAAGLEPIMQMTCRDRNSLALQSEALGAAVLGIKNILVLTGDNTIVGDHPFARPVFELDAVQLIQILKNLEKGNDLAGKSLDGNPEFFIGSAANPTTDFEEPYLIKLIKKIKVGAEFIQTQAVFDVEIFKKFSKTLNEKCKELSCPVPKVLAGIFLLKSAKNAHFINKNIPGVFISDKIIKRLESSSDQLEEGIKIAAELIKQIKSYCDGVHLMTMGNVGLAERIIG
jgi:5,10-methylenetetrahydrofolate reductase